MIHGILINLIEKNWNSFIKVYSVNMNIIIIYNALVFVCNLINFFHRNFCFLEKVQICFKFDTWKVLKLTIYYLYFFDQKTVIYISIFIQKEKIILEIS